jgi:outer membrane protein insertion porin family
MNWYVTLDWHDSSVDPTWWYSEGPVDYEAVRNLLSSGKTFSVLGTVQRTNTDRYLSYPKGDVEILNIQQAMDIMGSDWDFTKYWIEGRYYTPLTFLQNIFGTELGTEDNPAILAARVRAGFSSGTLPWADQYFLGGDKDLRGYEEDQFEGSEMFLVNVELRIPIQEAVGFVIFYDAGNAWGGVEWDSKYNTLRKDTSGFDFSDLHDAMGFGVRVRTPLGNIRLDVAEGDYETFTHFGFGELF